jgi:dephospho-CoA kinase
VIEESKRRPHLGGPDAPVLVLAGTTGSGKTQLADALARRGALRIDADRVGHEVLRDEAVRAAIVKAFGEEILDGRGEIDRRALGGRVFSDPDALRRLNALVHPPLVAEIARRVESYRATRACPLVVIDAALWWQFEPRPSVDLVVMVTADPAVREERIRARDGLEAGPARERMERQADVEASLERADAVLDTTVATPEAAREQLLRLLDERVGTRLWISDPAGTRP